jgi:hypothetical protein
MRAPSAAPKTSYLEILIILPDLLPLLDAPSPVDFIQPRPPARYPVDVSRIQFIVPAFPKLRSCPPAGEGRQHELKFDGFGSQSGCFLQDQWQEINGKNGDELTRRFPRIAVAVLGLSMNFSIIHGSALLPWCTSSSHEAS